MFETLLLVGGYASIVGLLLLGRRRVDGRDKESVGVKISPKQLAIIVPFRNEEDRISPLLKSLKNAPSDIRLVFVDDHSEDGSQEKIKVELNEFAEIISLPQNRFGKKAAIDYGIEFCESEYYLTLDADVELPDDYFKHLFDSTFLELNILPVEMIPSEGATGFFAWEYQLQVMGSRCLAGWFRPITASGANLLFSGELYQKAKNIRTDSEILSGDDQFLLSAAHTLNEKVKLVVKDALLVRTPGPKSVTEGFNQRLRWLGKTARVKDGLANKLGVLVLLIQLTFYLAIVSIAQNQGLVYAGLMLVLKSELDALINTIKYHKHFGTVQVWLFELAYPFYMLGLLIGLFLVHPQWKGRDIKKPSQN